MQKHGLKQKKYYPYKNILYITIAVLLLVMIFSMSALCNFCGLGSTGSSEGKIDVDAKDTTQENTATSAQENNEDSTQESQPDSSGKPTIKLKIHEGPFYSAEDDVCYWRIEAIVTGSPMPEEVAWSKNDTASYGPYIAQVNLTRASPAYTLKATVKNSKGEANDSIDLKWECGGDINIASGDGGQQQDQEDDSGGDQQQDDISQVVEFDVPVIYSEGGDITDTKIWSNTPYLNAGDTDTNGYIMGLASFDISSLSGVNINYAILDLGPISESGDVSFFNKFYITSIYWGAKNITNVSRSILEGEGSVIGSGVDPRNLEQPRVGNNTPDLKKEIQKAINEGKPRFQIRIHFSGPITDNDGELDIWSFKRENISLKVFYDN